MRGDHKLGYTTYGKFVRRGGLRAKRPARVSHDRLGVEGRVNVWLMHLFREGFLPIGEGEDPEIQLYVDGWPEWISVNRLAEIATLHLNRPISASTVGLWFSLAAPFIEKKQQEVGIPLGKGTLKIKNSRTFYRVGPFRGDILTAAGSACYGKGR